MLEIEKMRCLSCGKDTEHTKKYLYGGYDDLSGSVDRYFEKECKTCGRYEKYGIHTTGFCVYKSYSYVKIKLNNGKYIEIKL